MNIEFHTSQQFTRFGSVAADEYISNYLTTMFNRHGKENIMKYEIFFLPDDYFRVGVTIIKPDVNTVQETQNLIKI